MGMYMKNKEYRNRWVKTTRVAGIQRRHRFQTSGRLRIYGGPATITDKAMTRFLLTLDRAVETLAAAVRSGLPGEISAPQIPSIRIADLAKAMIGDRDITIEYTGIRPGENSTKL